MDISKENEKLNSYTTQKSSQNNRKQIYFDNDTNKYYLKIDNRNKIYEANLFGKKKSRLVPSKTGFINYNERVNLDSIDKLSFNIDDSLYHPQSTRFEGYTQFARPLVSPFTNLKGSNILKKKGREEIESDFIFNSPKNINSLNKELNQGLHFYSGKINNLVNVKNRNYVLNKINNALSSDKVIEDSRKKMNLSEKNSLIKLKKNILQNSTNVVHGRKLTRPKDKFVQRYIINYNVIIKNPIIKIKNKNKNVKCDNIDKYHLKELFNILNKGKNQSKLNLRKIMQDKVRKKEKFNLTKNNTINIISTKNNEISESLKNNERDSIYTPNNSTLKHKKIFFSEDKKNQSNASERVDLSFC